MSRIELRLEARALVLLRRTIEATQHARVAKGLLTKVTASEVFTFLLEDAAGGSEVQVPRAALRSPSDAADGADELLGETRASPRTEARRKEHEKRERRSASAILPVAMRKRRLNDGLSQGDVAAMFGLSASNYAAFENLRRPFPSRMTDDALKWAEGGPAPAPEAILEGRRLASWERAERESSVRGDNRDK